jgi:hypothetical protein
MREHTPPVLTLKALALPPVLRDFCDVPRGLVIVAGGPAQGKTTTLAAMARDRRAESAPEIVDGIRDQGTLEQALATAKAGRACFAAVEAPSVVSAFERIAELFPVERRREVLAELALNVAAVVAQELVPTPHGRARVPAVGILVMTPPIQQILSADRLGELNAAMATSHLGMQTFDQHLVELHERGVISYETALLHAHSASTVAVTIKTRRRAETFSPLWKDFVSALTADLRWPPQNGPSPFDPEAAFQRFLEGAGESARRPLGVALSVEGDDPVLVSVRGWAARGLDRLGKPAAGAADEPELEISVPGLSLADGSLAAYLTGGPHPEKITERHLDSAIVVSVSGRANMGGELFDRVARLVPLARRNGKPLIFDFSDWLYTDTGWSGLMRAAKESRAGGPAIAAVTPRQRAMKERFEMSRIHLVVPCHSSVDAALAAVAADIR